MRRLLVLVGSIGPLGHAPASGTVTVAVVGIPLFYLMQSWSGLTYLVVTALFIGASVWLHDRGDAVLGVKDSRRLVWDELCGFMIAVFGVPFVWQTVLVAFFVERLVDISKVPPANWIERNVRGGLGVVGDDVVAGLYTLALMHLLLRFLPGPMGIGS